MQIPVQTMRDMISVTTATASAAIAFVGIFIGLSKTNSTPGATFLTCDQEQGCDSFEGRLKLFR